MIFRRSLARLANARYVSAMILPDDDYVASPCISVCTVDPETKTCIGCLRTLREIGAWRTMTLDEKREVVRACDARAASQPRRGRDWKPIPP